MLLVVFQKTKYKIIRFLKHNNELVETIKEIIRLIKRKTNNEFKQIRCDNAGENLNSEYFLTEFPNIQDEFTAP